MKVVLFCGGYGMRMRDGVSDVPKPMAMVGDRPLIWNVMRYYAHFGHTEFVLAMGYGARHITSYFTHYDETVTNDFVMAGGSVRPLRTDIEDWSITFVNTGQDSPIGERLLRVREYLDGDEVFLANYADVLTDAPLDDMVDRFTASGATASLLAVPPQSAFHVVASEPDGTVTDIHSIADFPVRENGGYFAFRQELFDHLDYGEDLVGDALTALTARRQVLAYPYDGFWMPADTVKERAVLDDLARQGNAPWRVWDRGPEAGSASAAAQSAPLSGR